MEARIARLESQMEGARSDLRDLKSSASGLDARLRGVETGVATLTERVAHLPSKGFIVTATTTALAVIAALILFADKIKAIAGM